MAREEAKHPSGQVRSASFIAGPFAPLPREPRERGRGQCAGRVPGRPSDLSANKRFEHNEKVTTTRNEGVIRERELPWPWTGRLTSA